MTNSTTANEDNDRYAIIAISFYVYPENQNGI